MEGPLTVFAPVNEAFKAIPRKLYESEWKLHLQQLLKYHVVPDLAILTEDLSYGTELPTLEGNTVTVTQMEQVVMLNDNVQLLERNIDAFNGVIHTINKVLLPPSASKNMAQVIASNSDLSRLTALLEESNMISTLSGEGK